MVLLGAGACVAGAATVLLGAGSIIGLASLTPTADSEMRFYATWYVLAGVLAIRSARRVEDETFTIRVLFGGLFLAGCARALSLAVVGRPHAFSVVLMALELVLPLVILPWQAAVARREH